MSQAQLSQSQLASLQQLSFDNRFTRELPADPETRNFRRSVQGACYSRVTPTPVSAPSLLAVSADMLERLDLDPAVVSQPEFLQVFSGNRLLPDMDPFAMCYGGHQFGHWAGQLGDGRAIGLGDVINFSGERWSLQLKGAGPTPYSRTADGLAVLRSSLREFLCSEAMYYLGVPTTRALSLCLTGESVIRDMLYDGNPQAEPGAVVCRVAPSFLRFGNFQIFNAQRDTEALKQLLDYCIRVDFPHLPKPSVDTYLQWFNEVCTRTAEMIVHWQRVGFVHGVMNTDNMSILGLTIDYGPYGWLESYDPDWTPNTTDANGRRYRFGQQSQVALWNLLQLAEAIFPLIEQTEPLEEALQRYRTAFDEGWQKASANKLGLTQPTEQTQQLHGDLEQLLQQVETDMTLFYRALAEFDPGAEASTDDENLHKVFAPTWYRPTEVDPAYLHSLRAWLNRYRETLQRQKVINVNRMSLMNSVNPKFVLRNYLAQEAIDALQQSSDLRILEDLMQVLQSPYSEQPQYQRYAEKRPEWARHRAGCSMLSCSS